MVMVMAMVMVMVMAMVMVIMVPALTHCTQKPDVMSVLSLIASVCLQDSDTVEAYYDNGLIVSLLSLMCDTAKSQHTLRTQVATLIGILCKGIRH